MINKLRRDIFLRSKRLGNDRDGFTVVTLDVQSQLGGIKRAERF